MKNAYARLENWTWVLIYGGLLVAVLGGFVVRQSSDGLAIGQGLMLAGAVCAALGAALIVVRSRLGRSQPDEGSRP